jgi:peptidoglycan/LPS O-acetylase OafA/YrhL
MIKPKHRLEWLDSLRGIAAILVTIIHLFGELRYNYPHNSLFAKGGPLGFFIFDFLDVGRIGVVLFFLVSGFVIPFSLLNKGLKHFVTSRFFRLYPAYWISIIIAVLINGIISLKLVLVNITMFQKFLGVDDLVGVYWTLQIEICFYIICAILYKYKILYNEKIIIKIFYSFMILSFLMAFGRYITDKKLPVALVLGISVMFMGLIYRKYLLDEDTHLKKHIFGIFIVFIIMLLPICLLAYNKDYGFDEKWYKYFVSYLISILFFLVYSHYKWTNKLLIYLGTISYSLYLLHTLVFDFMDIHKIYSIISPLTCMLIFYAIALPASTLCYYFIEKPAVKYGRMLLDNKSRSND